MSAVKAPMAKKAKAVTVVASPESNGATAKPLDAIADQRATKIVGFLRKATRPARVATLRAFINAHMQPAALDEIALDAVIARLRERGRIVVNGTEVTYALD